MKSFIHSPSAIEVGTTKTKNQSFSKKKTKVSANNNDGDASSGEENHSRPSSTVSRKAAKLVYVEASPDQQGSQQKPRLPWEDCFEMLKEYTKIHGHANVNRKDPGPKGLKGFHLGRWVDRQRVRYRTKKLPREHIALLKSVGFAWNPGSGSKTPRFSSESAVVDKPTPSNRTVERESDVKSVQSRSSESLSSRKRSSTSDDDDEEERPSKRASLRRSVDATQEKNEPSLRSSRSRGSSQKFEGTDEALIWDRRFGELVEFSKHHGHIDVPFHPEKYFDLALWTVNQWAQYQSLSPDLRKKLNSVGISDEESIDDRNIRLWNEKFRMLEAYKAKHGHCDVPSQVIWGGIAIGKWVNNQRSNLKRRPFKGETKTRTKRLTDLGFTWYGSMPGMKA